MDWHLMDWLAINSGMDAKMTKNPDKYVWIIFIVLNKHALNETRLQSIFWVPGYQEATLQIQKFT